MVKDKVLDTGSQKCGTRNSGNGLPKCHIHRSSYMSAVRYCVATVQLCDEQTKEGAGGGADDEGAGVGAVRKAEPVCDR